MKSWSSTADSFQDYIEMYWPEPANIVIYPLFWSYPEQSTDRFPSTKHHFLQPTYGPSLAVSAFLDREEKLA